MRTTKMLLIFSFFLAVHSQANSQTNSTFDMDLPEAVSRPTSSNFVNSYENDLGRKAAPAVVTSYEEPAVSPHQIAEEPQSGYSSAFTSYRTQKSPEEIAEAQKEAWNKSQEKSDGLDLDGLADSPVEDNKYFTAPSSVNKYIHMSSNVKAPAKAKKVTASRAPASEEIPLPAGIDLSNEIEKLDSAPASSESSRAPVSAKERKEIILRTISQNYRDLKQCYNDGLKKSSEMKGKVVMGWAMDGQGRVSGAEVQTSQLNNKQVEKCMVDRLSGWRFPRQAKLQGSKDRMTYTFQFVSEKD